jgi:HPr kinase/phosphorylase
MSEALEHKLAAAMNVHASCAARDGDGVLLLGPPGAGKSDLLLRLLSRGWSLVADDRVELHEGQASPPAGLAGLLEVRGLGVMRLPHVAPVRVALAVRLLPDGARPARLPEPQLDATPGIPPGLPLVELDAAAASAPDRVLMALNCATGRIAQFVGAFTR